jgi:putative inorganic carbon (hco3(-)) transporter
VIESLLAIVAALSAAVGILARPSRLRSAAMVLALLLAPALIAGDQWESPRLEELRDSPGVLAVAALAGSAVIAALAAAMTRFPILLPVLILVALPFRIPLEVGDETANLLVPLYLVTGAGVLATALGRLPAREPLGSDGSTAPSGPATWLRPLLATSVVLFATGLLWSGDQSQGLQHLCFFLVPFAVVFSLMLDVPLDRRTLRTMLLVVAGLGLVWASVGFVEYQVRELLWNEAVIRSNEFHVYFRVNSLFWDPNIYGRYLAIVITVIAAALLWARQRNEAIALAVTSGVLWLALTTTFSQSSFIALLAGLATLAALRWSLRLVAGGITLLLVAGFLFAAFAGGLVKLDLNRLNPQTGGRANLVEGGVDLFLDRPVFGWGSGAFSRAFKEEIAGPGAPVTESHTEPVTVAAELGTAGLAVYLALMVAAFAALSAGMRGVMPGLGGDGIGAGSVRGPPGARAGMLAAFVAVLVHTVFYAGFLDDPVTWVLLAIGCSLAYPCRATSAA